MSGHWPPEWEDSDEEFPEEADQLHPDAEARLSEVTAYLVSLPAPVLPVDVEERISAALAAEAATRAGAAAAGDVAGQAEDAAVAGSRDGSTAGSSADSRTLGRTQARARAERRHGRLRVSRPLMVVGSLVVCLLLVGLGYGLSRSASGPAFSSAASGAANVPAAAPSAAASAASAGSASSFVVTESGTSYQSATLAAQVRARLTASNGTPVEVPGPISTRPAAAGSAAAEHASAPTSVLAGCVLHVTGGQIPRLVDRATYQGESAYIIATSSRVWVAGLGCTAAKPQVIVSVPLAK
jgi:hypothetical protein